MSIYDPIVAAGYDCVDARTLPFETLSDDGYRAHALAIEAVESEFGIDTAAGEVPPGEPNPDSVLMAVCDQGVVIGVVVVTEGAA